MLDVSALGGYEEIDRFFQRLAVSHRLVDVESLTLDRDDRGRDPARDGAAPSLLAGPRAAAAPARVAARPPGRRAAPTLDAFLHDQALAFAKSEASRPGAARGGTPRLFLSELAAAARERPVVLAYASLGEEFTIRGLALGEGPLRAFESRLERGFFRLSDFLMAKPGRLLPLRGARAEPGRGARRRAAPAGRGPVRAGRDGVPRRSRRGAAPVTVRGREPTAKEPGRGPLTLRLRDVDLTDVFQALAAAGAGSYVVDDGVAGRVSVEMTRATLDEVLSRAAQVGRCRGERRQARCGASLRASPGCGATRRPAAATAPASFALKRAEVRDVLAAMAEADASLASLGPPGYLGRVSVWTKDAPLGAVRAAVLDAAGLSEQAEDDRRILERRTGASDAPVPVARSGGEPRLALRPEDLTVRELELAGIALRRRLLRRVRVLAGGRAHAYAPAIASPTRWCARSTRTRSCSTPRKGPLRLTLAAADELTVQVRSEPLLRQQRGI